MKALGKHILAEFYGCSFDTINNTDLIEKLFLFAAKESGATIIDHNFHKFEPQGVSGVVIISESHLTIHTWPEYEYCAIDIFTCGDRIDNDYCLRILEEGLQAKNISITEMRRGILNLSICKEQSIFSEN